MEAPDEAAAGEIDEKSKGISTCCSAIDLVKFILRMADSGTITVSSDKEAARDPKTAKENKEQAIMAKKKPKNDANNVLKKFFMYYVYNVQLVANIYI